MIGIVFNDAIGPSPDGAGRKVSALPMIGRQHHGHDISQQPGQTAIGPGQLDTDGSCIHGPHPLQMAKEWVLLQALQRCEHICGIQQPPIMKAHRRTQIEEPLPLINLLPVMGQITLDFPIFLIYPRQPVEYLPHQMGFRTT